MMDDFNEPESYDEKEIEFRIEDLGAPDKRLSLFIYSLGKRLPAFLARLRTVPVALVLLASLFAIILLPGSSLMQPGVPSSAVPAVSVQQIECSHIVVVVSTASVIQYIVPSDSTPSSSGTTYACGSIQILTPVPRTRQP